MTGLRAARRHPLVAARRLTLLLALSLTLAPTVALSAQARGADIPGVTLDASFGLATSLKASDGVDRVGATGALILSRSMVKVGAGWLVGAVEGSLLGRAAEFVELGQGDGVGADRITSSHMMIGALAGWGQRADQSEGARLLAGPAYFARGQNASGMGLVARFDGAKDTAEAIGLTFFLEAQVTPEFNGKRDVIALFGVGLRVR